MSAKKDLYVSFILDELKKGNYSRTIVYSLFNKSVNFISLSQFKAYWRVAQNQYYEIEGNKHPLKKYTIQFYPKNKQEDLSKLTDKQIELRIEAIVKEQKGKKFECMQCKEQLTINEYYFKIRPTFIEKDKTCRYCRIKNSGVLNVGSIIGKKEFENITEKYKCSICYEFKKKTEYSKNKSVKYPHRYGISYNCKECQNKLNSHYNNKRYKVSING